MNNKVYLNNRNNPIYIEKKALASGGEGDIYRVVSPSKYTGYVVKLYHKEKRTSRKEAKVRFLLQNPPEAQNNNGHNSLVWPAGMIYDNRGFAGLMMPFAQGDKLVILGSNKIPRKYRAKWQRFALQNPDSLEMRLKICFNIAAAVYQIHSTGRYVLVDLKPDNVLIQPNGLVAIVDVDSMEIIKGDSVLFPAAVTTPEFAPPEFYRDVQPGKTPIFSTWDRYSMAIIFYKLLFGIHPFAASARPPYDKLVSLHEKIEHGLFIHHPEKTPLFTVVPPPHRRFFKLRPQLQELFIQCFADGHLAEARRPTADEWCSVISGKSLVHVNRPLPSRVLALKNIDYTKARPLPIPATAAVNTRLQPAVPKLEPVAFRGNKLGEMIAMGSLGILAFAISKSLMVSMMLGMVVLAVAYNFRKEVSNKRLVASQHNALTRRLFLQETKVSDLKREVSKYNDLHKNEIKELQNNQNKILQKEHLSIDELRNNFFKMLKEKDELLIALEEEEKNAIEQLKSKYPNIPEEDEQEETDVAAMKNEMARLKLGLADIDDLEEDVMNTKLTKKPYLLTVAHKLRKLKEEEKAALKKMQQDIDKRIAAENRKLTNNKDAQTVKSIQKNVRELHALNEKMKRDLHNDEFKRKYAEVMKEKTRILNRERTKIKKELMDLQRQIDDAKKMVIAEEELEAFNEAKKLIEEKYNEEYQIIVEEGKKKQAEIQDLIAVQREDTNKNVEQLFSKSIIPYDAGANFGRYEQESKQLIQIRQEVAKSKGVMNSYDEINFWKYMELVLTWG